MTIHLSNPSKQNVDFYYRMPFPAPANLQAHIEIPSGGQVTVGHGWTAEQKGVFLKHLMIQGGRDAAEVYAQMGKFTGLLYRDDGVISEDEIRLGHDAIVDTQERRSAAEATRGALAFDRAANARGRGQRVARVTETSVREEVGPYEKPTGKEINFSMSIDPDGRGDAPLPL